MADPCKAYKDEVQSASQNLARVLDDPDHTPDDYKRARQNLAQAEGNLNACQINNPLSTPMTRVGQTMVTVGDYTYWFVVDLAGRILYSRWKLGSAYQGWREVGGDGRTDATPAASVIQRANYIFLSIKGLDGNLYLNQGELHPEGTDTWVGWQ